MNDRPPRDRWLLVLGFCWVFLFIVFVLFKTVVPSPSGGWSPVPAVDLLFILAFMLCFLGISIWYSYRAWTKNADEYAEWLVAQQLFGASWTKFWIEFFTKEYYLWSARLLGPIAVVFALVVFILMALSAAAGRIPP